MIRSFVQRARPIWFILTAALVWAVTILGAGWLVHKSLLILIMLLIGSLVALLLDPLVKWLSRSMPRWAGIVLVYLAILGILIVLGFLIVPAVVSQAKGFPHEIPILQQKAQSWIQESPIHRYVDWYQNDASDNVRRAVQDNLGKLNQASSDLARVVVDIILGTLKWMVHGIIILVISIYLLLDKQHFIEWFNRVTPPANRVRLTALFADLIGVLSGYLRGLCVMVLFVAILVSLACKIAGNPYWLFIGCLAGVLEVIPYFGAVAGAIPAVSMALAQHGPWWGLGMAVYFVAINQAEGHVVVPVVMGHSMHMRPLTVLLSLLIGAEVDGVLGMVIGVPVVGMVRVLWSHAGHYFTQPPSDAGAPNADDTAIEVDGHPPGNSHDPAHHDRRH